MTQKQSEAVTKIKNVTKKVTAMDKGNGKEKGKKIKPVPKAEKIVKTFEEKTIPDVMPLSEKEKMEIRQLDLQSDLAQANFQKEIHRIENLRILLTTRVLTGRGITDLENYFLTKGEIVSKEEMERRKKAQEKKENKK